MMQITEAQRAALTRIRQHMAECSDFEITSTLLGGEINVYGVGRVLHIYGNLNRVTIFPDGRFTTTDYGRACLRPSDLLAD
jgi:hypothetical protein